MKMWNYLVILAFLALLFEFAGLSIASTLLSWLGVSIEEGVSAFESGLLWSKLKFYLAGAVGARILVGFITKSSSENYVLLPLITAEIGAFIICLTGILSVASAQGAWIFYITLLIISPLTVGFAVAAYQHFRGID